jgi:hypothetical protein
MISIAYAMFVVCTSNLHNIKQCLPVWNYIPAYYQDYQDFKATTSRHKDNTIYYREKQLLNGLL